MSLPSEGPGSVPVKRRLSSGWQVIISLVVVMTVMVAALVTDVVGVGPRQWWCQLQADQVIRPVPGVVSVQAACASHIEYIDREVEVVIDATTDEATVEIGKAVLTTMAESQAMQEWSVPRFRRLDGGSTAVVWSQLDVSPQSLVMEVRWKWGLKIR